MNADEILSLDATELTSHVRAGRVTAVAATEAALSRAEAVQPLVNAFIALDPDGALAAAREIDARRGRGDVLPPLAGVPVAHKDMFYRQGRPSSAGSKIRRDFVAGTTCTLLERLDVAGAIEIGRLNMAEFAAGPTGHNDHYGDCCNPWNPAHVTGGSSSGSGAAVAAEAVFAALGSDTGGSVRLPAAACGVTGIKGTWGRVSRYACVPRAWSLDCVGPLTRSAADAALVLSAIAGHDENDPTTSARRVPDYPTLARKDPAGLRIGIPAGGDMDGVAEEVADAHREAVAVLRGLGVTPVERRLPDLAPLWALGDVISKAESATMHLPWLRERPGDFAMQVLARTEVGVHVPAVAYLQALSLRARFLEEFVAGPLADVDALLLPVIPMPVPTREETATGASGEVAAMVGAMTRFTRPVNYLGLPSVSLPCGFSGSGLPIAFQLVGRPFAEATLLRLGVAYQSVTDWHRRRPPLFAPDT